MPVLFKGASVIQRGQCYSKVTCDRPIRSRVLYPAELRTHILAID